MQTVGSEQDRPLACVACAGGDGLRTITISPWGTVESLKGTYVLDEEAATAIVASFDKHGTPLPIDVEHETIDENTPPGQRRGAVGWIERLYADASKGLMGMVRWTDRGRELIRSGAFSYLSPVLIVRVADRRAVELHSAGLTVKPAIPRMEKLAASQTTETKAMEGETMKDTGGIVGKIAGLLKIEATGEADALLQAIFEKVKTMMTDGVAAASPKTTNASHTADRVVANAARSVLGLSNDAGETETLVALGQMLLAAVHDKERTLKLNALVERWIRKGVINPDDKYPTCRKDAEEMIALAAVSPNEFETIMRARQASRPPRGRTSPPAPTGALKADRARIIADAVREFEGDERHARMTNCHAFANLALMDAGLEVMHADETGMIPEKYLTRAGSRN